MNRAALFFDIDGTVLSEITKEIPASTIDALKRAHDAGHFLFINTGRTYCSVPVELKKLPFDGYLCGCGIYFTFDEEVIFEKHLDPERGDEIADYMTKCQIDALFLFLVFQVCTFHRACRMLAEHTEYTFFIFWFSWCPVLAAFFQNLVDLFH